MLLKPLILVLIFFWSFGCAQDEMVKKQYAIDHLEYKNEVILYALSKNEMKFFISATDTAALNNRIKSYSNIQFKFQESQSTLIFDFADQEYKAFLYRLGFHWVLLDAEKIAYRNYIKSL